METCVRCGIESNDAWRFIANDPPICVSCHLELVEEGIEHPKKQYLASSTTQCYAETVAEKVAKMGVDFNIKRLKNTPLGFPRFSAACPTCGKRRTLRRFHYYEKERAIYLHTHDFYCCSTMVDWQELELETAYPGESARGDQHYLRSIGIDSEGIAFDGARA